MKAMIFRGVAIFILLFVATSMMMDVFNTKFGTIDFFQKHSFSFLFFITIFPRLTLLFSSVATGGFLWWLGFLFVPRLLVASLATVAYFHTNPVLVTISWLVAIGGEVFEKYGLGKKKSRFIFRTYRAGSRSDSFDDGANSSENMHLKNDDVIEAEFTKKD